LPRLPSVAVGIAWVGGVDVLLGSSVCGHPVNVRSPALSVAGLVAVC